MKTHSFENNRIRATVTENIVEHYKEKAALISRSTGRLITSETRALILSDAMRKLACAAQAAEWEKPQYDGDYIETPGGIIPNAEWQRREFKDFAFAEGWCIEVVGELPEQVGFLRLGKLPLGPVTAN